MPIKLMLMSCLAMTMFRIICLATGETEALYYASLVPRPRAMQPGYKASIMPTWDVSGLKHSTLGAL